MDKYWIGVIGVLTLYIIVIIVGIKINLKRLKDNKLEVEEDLNEY